MAINKTDWQNSKKLSLEMVFIVLQLPNDAISVQKAITQHEVCVVVIHIYTIFVFAFAMLSITPHHRFTRFSASSHSAIYI